MYCHHREVVTIKKRLDHLGRATSLICCGNGGHACELVGIELILHPLWQLLGGGCGPTKHNARGIANGLSDPAAKISPRPTP